MNLQNALSAVVHDQVGHALEGLLRGGPIENLFNIRVSPTESLLGQLTGPGDGAPRISIGFGLDILGTPFRTVTERLPLSNDRPLGLLRTEELSALIGRVQDALRGQVSVLDALADPRDAIAKLIGGQGPAGLRRLADDLFGAVRRVFEGAGGDDDAVNTVDRLRQLVGGDIGIALPFATLIKAVQGAGRNAAAIPRNVEQGAIAYFFDAEGFGTVDGESVVAPVHLSDIREAAGQAIAQRDLGAHQLRGLFSKTTAERYLRDLIRIIVESAYDSGRGLEARFKKVKTELQGRASANKAADAIERQFVTWYRGFSAMAESAAMRAVEVGTQGVSEFQTNPLIAAGAGSFAGTVARKLAQDSFLTKLRVDLGGTD